MPLIFPNSISTLLCPVFSVGSFWPCLQQWYHSDWSSTVQHSTGSVQPPSHRSCPLPLCCASHRSVPVQRAAAAAYNLSTCLMCSIPTLSSHTILIIYWNYLHLEINAAYLVFPFDTSFPLLLWQVTLQELCGLELRKEGSLLNKQLSSINNTLRVKYLLAKDSGRLSFFSPISVSQYTGTLSLCWQEALSAGNFPLRGSSFAHVSVWNIVFKC